MLPADDLHAQREPVLFKELFKARDDAVASRDPLRNEWLGQ